MERPWYEYIEPDDFGWDDRKGELYPLYDQVCVDALIDTINKLKEELRNAQVRLDTLGGDA